MNKNGSDPRCRDLPALLQSQGRGSPLRMDTNTNPLGANPAGKKALQGMRRDGPGTSIRPPTATVCGGTGRFYGLDMDNFVVGNGSDEILDIICQDVHGAGRNGHHRLSRLLTARLLRQDQRREVSVEVDLMTGFPTGRGGHAAGQGQDRHHLHPQQPDLQPLPQGGCQAVIEGSDRPVVVDEAYGEFAGESFIPLVDKYRRTSSSPGPSPRRTVWRECGSAIVACKRTWPLAMQKVKMPYSLNKVSEHVAIAALQGPGLRGAGACDIVNGEGSAWRRGCRRLGFHVFPPRRTSSCSVPKELGPAHMPAWRPEGRAHPGLRQSAVLENCVRTTIGTREHERPSCWTRWGR